MADPRETKAVIIGNITVETIFQNFDSILLIDAGATDGFLCSHSGGTSSQVPTGVPISIGKSGGGAVPYLKVSPSAGKSLNVTYFLYQ
jgi:hypothetical protein